MFSGICSVENLGDGKGLGEKKGMLFAVCR